MDLARGCGLSITTDLVTYLIIIQHNLAMSVVLQFLVNQLEVVTNKMIDLLWNILSGSVDIEKESPRLARLIRLDFNNLHVQIHIQVVPKPLLILPRS